MEFAKRKSMALSAMASEGPDKSPKGSLDEPIVPLLNAINAHPSYFTTSSCSGRISILPHTQNDAKNNENKKKKNKAGDWLFISHEFADPNVVVERLFCPSSSCEGTMVFRFEPFILAVDCVDVSSAHSLVAMAISCGFRESGISSVSKRIMVAIRCSLRMEVPLGEMGRIMVSPEYVRYLVAIANEKMEANKKRTDAFLRLFLASKGSAETTRVVANNDKQQGCMEERNVLDLEAKHLELEVLSGLNSLECDASMSASVQRLYSQLDVSNDVHTNKGVNSGSSHKCCLSSVEMRTLGLPVEKLFLWGHSSSLLNSLDSKQILVFGGFGGIGRHSRQNESLLLDPLSGMLKVLHAEGPPPPLMGHTASVIGNRVFVIGGRGDPTQIFSDVWVLHAAENKWELVSCSGSVFGPRHRHAAASVGSKIYVHGGLYHETVYGSLSVLETETLQWAEIIVQGEQPCARHSHSLVASGSELYMFGGYDGETALEELYNFDTRIHLWKKVKTTGRGPSARFSHLTFIYRNYLGVLGGCPVTKRCQGVFLLDLESRVWKHVEIDFINYPMLVRSTVNVNGDHLILVGGGASCYAFGTRFNQPMKIDCCPLTCVAFGENVNHSAIIETPLHFEGSKMSNGIDPTDSKGFTPVLDDGHLEYDACACATNGSSKARDERSVEKHAVQIESTKWVLQIQRRYAKRGKDILKKAGWLDTGRKVYKTQDEQIIFLPVTEKCHTFFVECVSCSNELVKSSQNSCPAALYSGEDFPLDVCLLPELQKLLLASGASLVEDDVALIRKVPKSPQKILKEAVTSLIQQKGLPPHLLEQLPSRWEHLGDIIVLPAFSFQDVIWDSIGVELWPIVARSLGAVRLARQGWVAPTGTRDSTLEILVGDDGWVTHFENGIYYSFDSTKCMFSWGNLSEKLRMAKLDCRNETVIDLFAGIGYFVLPFLVKAGAQLVYACEWNPHALEALRKNVIANSVSDRCIILEGDNRDVAPQDVADRVCLGLLPTSEGSWRTAVRALKPEGGILHVHGNIRDSEEESWPGYVEHSIQGIAKSEGRQWHVHVNHVQRVKWYAPHIRHLVADVRCSLDLNKGLQM